MLAYLPSRINIPTLVRVGIFLLLTLQVGQAQPMIEQRDLENTGPDIASLLGSLEFNHEGDVRGIILTARQGDEILAQTDVPARASGQGKVEMGVYLTPIIGGCGNTPTLFVHLYLGTDEGSREATNTHCYTLEEGARLSDGPPLDGAIRQPELDQWYAVEAIQLESEETFERSREASSFITFYVFFSSQELPDLEQDFPSLPAVETLADIEAIMLMQQ